MIHGRDVSEGDAIAFVPGGKPVRVDRIGSEQHTQTALNMTYRICYDLAGFGYALFDDAPIWSAAPARSVVEG